MGDSKPLPPKEFLGHTLCSIDLKRHVNISVHAHIYLPFFILFIYFFATTPVACGISQARGRIRPAAAGLHHTTMQDPSCICDLGCSLQQCQILNPLSEASDRTSQRLCWVLFFFFFLFFLGRTCSIWRFSVLLSCPGVRHSAAAEPQHTTHPRPKGIWPRGRTSGPEQRENSGREQRYFKIPNESPHTSKKTFKM